MKENPLTVNGVYRETQKDYEQIDQRCKGLKKITVYGL